MHEPRSGTVLYDGAYHEVDNSPIAFEIAARTAMKEGAELSSCWSRS